MHGSMELPVRVAVCLGLVLAHASLAWAQAGTASYVTAPTADFLPTGMSAPAGAVQQQTVTRAAPAAAAAQPAVMTAPRLKPSATPGCLTDIPASYQCGGNMTSVYATCSQFDSCDNTAWQGACCPAASKCQQVRSDYGPCWSCGGSVPPFLAQAQQPPNMCTTNKNGDFDYGCVLGASLLFYEAQRSGKLPASNRIKWRGDAGLLDKAPNGQPLVGGFYDAGDITKFTFPAAFTLSNLALAYLEFPETFSSNSQGPPLMELLKWGADYLMAARYDADSLVIASWVPGATIAESHLNWNRPEEIQVPVQMLALTGSMAGADVLAQTAAALAAASLVLRDSSPAYAAEVLDAARGLYVQASQNQGLYSKSFPQVERYYKSFTYIDDLCWAAAWLAWATGESEYVDNAKFFWKRHQDEEGGGEGRRYDYNNMIQAMGYVLAKTDPDNKDVYLQPIRTVMGLWLKGESSIVYSPKGMAWIDSWGNLRYVANQAFMGLLHNKAYPMDQNRKTAYTCFARKQMRYILGETGRSFVVGVGPNQSPCQAHHRGASCGPLTQKCDCTAYVSNECNPNVIYGGLVGGPDKEDNYADNRLSYTENEVALDWNAGFTGVMAGLGSGAFPGWDQCVSAGQVDGRGQVSDSLNAAGDLPQGRAAGWWAGVLCTCLVALFQW